MIRTVSVKINAANPSIPLPKFEVEEASAVTVILQDVPKSRGKFAVREISATVTNTDAITSAYNAVKSGDEWIVTIPSDAIGASGVVTGGVAFFGAGTDEHGENVWSWALGHGDLVVRAADGSIKPGEKRVELHYFDAAPEHPSEGNIAPIDGTWSIYSANAWQPFGAKDYNGLANKPSINGVTLVGNKTAADLSLATSNHTHANVPTYTDLNNRLDKKLDIVTPERCYCSIKQKGGPGIFGFTTSINGEKIKQFWFFTGSGYTYLDVNAETFTKTTTGPFNDPILTKTLDNGAVLTIWTNNVRRSGSILGPCVSFENVPDMTGGKVTVTFYSLQGSGDNPPYYVPNGGIDTSKYEVEVGFNNRYQYSGLPAAITSRAVIQRLNEVTGGMINLFTIDNGVVKHWEFDPEYVGAASQFVYARVDFEDAWALCSAGGLAFLNYNGSRLMLTSMVYHLTDPAKSIITFSGLCEENGKLVMKMVSYLRTEEVKVDTARLVYDTVEEGALDNRSSTDSTLKAEGVAAEASAVGSRLETIEERPYLEETKDGHVAVVIPE